MGFSEGEAPSWGLGFAGFESSDVLRGRAGNVGENVVAVVDAEGGAGLFDGNGSTGVADPDVDALSGDDEGAAAGSAGWADRVAGSGRCRGGADGAAGLPSCHQ